MNTQLVRTEIDLNVR